MSKNIGFLIAEGMEPSQIDELTEIIAPILKDKDFDLVLLNQKIETVSKDELMRILKNEN